VADPNHAAGNYNHLCTQCHTTAGWTPADFDHNLARFKLTGAHPAVSCNLCHTAGYTGTPMTCFACHEQDYLGVTDPNHLAGNYNHDCTICHTTMAWMPATVDHNRTRFPLTGAHVTVACNLCHANGYTGTPMDCFACHQTEYTNTTTPNHAAANFPTTCATCHTTTAWMPANWDHDAQHFPIYSGPHKEAWNDCADCHVNPANYQVFECINCHKHRQPEMDDKHKNVNGYAWISASCYNCHPRGRK
jgi:hypothetical protein